MNFYANWGIGFKSGGFNNQGSAAIVDAHLTNLLVQMCSSKICIERKSRAPLIGFKGDLLDGAVNFDLAGYYTTIDDMQFFEFFVGAFGLLKWSRM